MKLKYEEITLKQIEDNPHMIFECDGDSKKVKVSKGEEYEHNKR